MILLYNLLKILYLTAPAGGPVILGVALDRPFLGRAAIKRNLRRHPMAADGLRAKALGGLRVARLRQEESNGRAVVIHGALALALRAFPLDVRLIHPPAEPARALTALARLLALWAVRDDPSVNCRGVQFPPRSSMRAST